MFRSIVAKLTQNGKSLNPSTLAGFCTKVPFKHFEINDVKILGNVVTDSYEIRPGVQSLTVKTRESPKHYQNHKVYIHYKNKFKAGQRVYVTGQMTSTENIINGKNLSNIMIRAEQVYILENESGTSSTTAESGGDQNSVEIVANVASNVSAFRDNSQFCVAIHHNQKDESGQDESKTNFYRVEAHDDAIRNYIHEYIKKSDRVHLSGTIKHRVFIEEEDGQRRHTGYLHINGITKVARRPQTSAFVSNTDKIVSAELV